MQHQRDQDSARAAMGRAEEDPKPVTKHPAVPWIVLAARDQAELDQTQVTTLQLARNCSAAALSLQDCLANCHVKTRRDPTRQGQGQTLRLPPVRGTSQTLKHR
eukprot:4293989-Amphidinium_carterae.1